MTPSAIVLTFALVAVIVFIGPAAVLWACVALTTGEEAVGTRSKQRRPRPRRHTPLTILLVALCVLILLCYGGLFLMWIDRGGRR